MKQIIQDIFLLMGKLVKEKSSQRVIQLYIDNMNGLYSDFVICEKKSDFMTNVIELKSKKQQFGSLYMNKDPKKISEEFSDIFHNSIQILVSILEKLEY